MESFFFFLVKTIGKRDIHSQKLGGIPSTLYSSSCNTCINILVPFKCSFKTFKMCYQALMRMCVLPSLIMVPVPNARKYENKMRGKK